MLDRYVLENAFRHWKEVLAVEEYELPGNAAIDAVDRYRPGIRTRPMELLRYAAISLGATDYGRAHPMHPISEIAKADLPELFERAMSLERGQSRAQRAAMVWSLWFFRFRLGLRYPRRTFSGVQRTLARAVGTC